MNKKQADKLESAITELSLAQVITSKEASRILRRIYQKLGETSAIRHALSSSAIEGIYPSAALRKKWKLEK